MLLLDRSDPKNGDVLLKKLNRFLRNISHLMICSLKVQTTVLLSELRAYCFTNRKMSPRICSASKQIEGPDLGANFQSFQLPGG